MMASVKLLSFSLVLLVIAGCYSKQHKELADYSIRENGETESQSVIGSWVSVSSNKSGFVGFQFNRDGTYSYRRNGLFCDSSFNMLEAIDNTINSRDGSAYLDKCSERVTEFKGDYVISGNKISFGDREGILRVASFYRDKDGLNFVYDPYNKGGLSGFDTIRLVLKP